MEHVVPTAKEKLAIYQLAKEYILRNTYICHAIILAQRDLNYFKSNYKIFDSNDFLMVNQMIRWSVSTHSLRLTNNLESNFPELYKLKPMKAIPSSSWWKMYDIKVNPARLRAIDKMIVEVQSKI